jgi:4-aminobutyrate aminotransferase-like enzyme
MIGVELVRDTTALEPAGGAAMWVLDALRRRGFLVGLAGANGQVVSLSPPFVITDEQRRAFVEAFDEVLASVPPEER